MDTSRSVARGESGTLADFGDANDLPVVMRAGGREDIYFSAVKYPWAENVYLAFPLYYHYVSGIASSRKKPHQCRCTGCKVAVSRDGISGAF